MSMELVQQIKINAKKNPFGDFPTLFPHWWDFLTEGFGGVTLLDITEICDEQMKNRRQRLLIQRLFETFKSNDNLFVCVVGSRVNYNMVCLFKYDVSLAKNSFFSFECKNLEKDKFFDYYEGDDRLEVDDCLISCGGIDFGNLIPEHNAPNDLLKKWISFNGHIAGCIYEHMSDHPQISQDKDNLISFVRSLIPVGESFAFFTFVQEPGAYIEEYYFILKKNN